MFVLWDADGKKIEGEYPPTEIHNLLATDTDASVLDFDLPRIVAKIRALSQLDVSSVHKLAQNHYTVLDATVSDSSHFIIRVATVENPLDSHSLSWTRDKLRRECEMMRWMYSLKSELIPKIYACELDVARPFMISDKCEGKLVADAFGILSDDAKLANIASYAAFAIEVFRAPSPKGIGSISSYTEKGQRQLRSGLPSLGPYIDPSCRQTPHAPFETIGEYFKWLSSVKMQSESIGTTKADINTALGTLQRLELHLSDALSRLDPLLLRSVPSHEDLESQNVFIDDAGHITGIIDWEFHMVKPAVLAAAYPSWIRYDGTHDPQFADRNSQFSSFWMTSPFEAERLRREYDSIASKGDPEYYRALKEGEIFRQAEGWLKYDTPDFGCKRMQAWLDTLP